MSLGGAFVDERAVTAERLNYPPVPTDFDDARHAPANVETSSVQPVTDPGFGHLCDRSSAMRTLYDQIGKASGAPVTILIMGELDAGRELVTRTVHDMSPRADRAFIAMSCDAISPNLIESGSFDHEKGSFIGASQHHTRYFEHACDGMIFLGGIAKTPVEMQMKLLRVLGTGVSIQVGSTEPVQTRIRIIAATNRDLFRVASDGALCEDLMCRLAVVLLHILSLRDHGDDIEELVLYFLARLDAAHQADKVFSCQALVALRTQTWPGNVRELRDVVRRGYIPGKKTVKLVTPPAQARGPARPTMEGGMLNLSAEAILVDTQRATIVAALEHSHGNRRQVTKTLGVSLKTLYSRPGLY